MDAARGRHSEPEGRQEAATAVLRPGRSQPRRNAPAPVWRLLAGRAGGFMQTAPEVRQAAQLGLDTVTQRRMRALGLARSGGDKPIWRTTRSWLGSWSRKRAQVNARHGTAASTRLASSRPTQPRVQVASPDPFCAGEHASTFSACGLGALHLLPCSDDPRPQPVEAPEQGRDAVRPHQDRTAAEWSKLPRRDLDEG